MPGAGDQPLQEYHATAERPRGLLPGALVGIDELGVVRDHPDAAPTAACGRLQHQRVADLGCGCQGSFHGLDRTATPRRDRHTDLLGDQLRADLVAELAHGVRAGADEGDSDLFAQLREGRVFRDETPADPSGVGFGLHQRTFERLQIQVRACGRRTEVVGDVGLAHERRVPVDIGVQCDGFDRSRGLRGQVSDGVDEAHGGLSPVHDGNAAEHSRVLPFQSAGPIDGRGVATLGHA